MEYRIEIDGKTISPDSPCYVIAEAGVNHNGDIDLARTLVDIAVDAGADAIKFQTFSAERLASRNAPKAGYQRSAGAPEESQYEMLARLELSADDHVTLKRYCASRGVTFLSTPFDELAADFLAELGVPAFKTPSGELTNLAYLRHIARFGKPMIVSTGMATLAEVDAAISAIESGGSPPVALLHCVSNYPAAPEHVNLRAMHTLERAFGVPAGYSDHTNGIDVALASVAMGARIIEKHFTYDRSAPGPDHRASLEPAELKAMIASMRTIESALGDGRKRPAASEAATAAVARKSCVARRAVRSGAIIVHDDVTLKRPGTGIAPSMLSEVLGRTARHDIDEGTVLSWGMLL